MSVAGRFVGISCDVCGGIRYTESTTVRGARNQVILDGFKRVNGKDICGDCPAPPKPPVADLLADLERSLADTTTHQGDPS